MQALRVAIQAAKAETLRSAHLPQRTVAVEVEMARVLMHLALAVVVEASVQREPLHPHQVQMAQEAGPVAVLLLVSTP